MVSQTELFERIFFNKSEADRNNISDLDDRYLQVKDMVQTLEQNSTKVKAEIEDLHAQARRCLLPASSSSMSATT